MFTIKNLLLLPLAMATMLATSIKPALASPPSIWTDSPKASSQIIVLEPPQLDTWTKIKLRTVAWNEDWKGRGVPVYLRPMGGVMVRPRGKDVKWWKNINQGDVFETEFEIMPYMVGTLEFEINFGKVFSDGFLLVLDDSCNVSFCGKWEEIFSKIGYDPDNVKDPIYPLTPEQREKMNQLLPGMHDMKPTITKEKVIIRKRDLRFEITPHPAIGQKSRVTVMVPSWSKEAGLKVTAGSGLQAILSPVSKWEKIKNEKYIVDFTLTPKQAGEDVMNVYFRPENRSAYVYEFTFTIGEDGKLKSVRNAFKAEPVEVQP